MATTRSSLKTDTGSAPARTQDAVVDAAAPDPHVPEQAVPDERAPQRENASSIPLDHRAVLDTLADAVIAADATNTIIYVNAATERLLGWTARELTGQQVTVIQPERLRSAHVTAFRRFVATGDLRLRRRPVRVPALRQDGTEVDVELSLDSVTGRGGTPLVIASLRDISSRVELEQQLEVMRYLRASTEAAARLGSLLDVEQVLTTVVESLVSDFDSTLARVWISEPGSTDLRLRASAGSSVGESDAKLMASLAAGIGAFEVNEVIRTRRPFVRNSLAGDPDFDHEWLADAQVGAVAAYPIFVGEELRGVVAHFTRKELTHEVVEVLSNYVAVVAASLHDLELLEREQAARARAAESLSLVDTIFASAPVGLAFWDRDLRYVRINESLATMNGIPVDAHLGRRIDEVLPGLGSELAETLSRVLDTGDPVVDHEIAGATPLDPGRERTWLASYYPVRDASGATIGVGAVVAEVTERKLADAALRETEERFRLLVEGVEDYAIFMHDAEGTIVSWNAGAERIMGYPSDEIIGHRFDVFYPLEERVEGTPEADLSLAIERGRLETEGWRVRRDGSRIWANVVITPLHDESGRLRGYSKVLRDVTQQRNSQDRLRFLAEASSILSSSLDYQATLLRVAESAVPDLADWCAVDVVEQGSIQRVAMAHADPARLELAHELQKRYPPNPDDLYGVPNVIRTGRAEFASQVPESLLRAFAQDGEHLELLRALGVSSYIIVPLVARGHTLGAITLVAHGEFHGAERVYGPADVAVAEDLAHRAAIAVENARLYREAQQAIGARDEFLSLASHELRTPVTILHAYTQALSRSVTKSLATEVEHAPDGATVALDRTRLTGNLDAMNHAIARLVALIEDLLDVSRLQRGSIQIERIRMDLSSLLTRVVDGFTVQQQQGRISNQISIRLELPDAASVWGEWDPDRLDQVANNLVENAVKYSRSEGTVTVALVVESLEGGQTQTHLSITDQGIGIPPDQQAAIFQPYSRATNASIRNYPGFGMGLAVAHEIVERLGGRIWVESAGEDRGSTFHVVLPGGRLEPR